MLISSFNVNNIISQEYFTSNNILFYYSEISLFNWLLIGCISNLSNDSHNVTRPNLVLVLFPGLVPERAGEMAAYVAEAGGQDGQVRWRGGRRQPRRPWALRELRRKWRAADEPALYARRSSQSGVPGVPGLRVIFEVQVLEVRHLRLASRRDSSSRFWVDVDVDVDGFSRERKRPIVLLIGESRKEDESSRDVERLETEMDD